nr:hypothetical protein [Tanacetum cinerariifolium]
MDYLHWINDAIKGMLFDVISGDERAANRLIHRATAALYGSCGGGEPGVSRSDESVSMNVEVSRCSGWNGSRDRAKQDDSSSGCPHALL